MATKKKTSINEANKELGRPVPNTPKTGYTSNGRRYGKGGRLKKK